MHSIYFATGGNYKVSAYAMRAAINNTYYGFLAFQQTLEMIQQLQSQWGQVSLGNVPPTPQGSIFDTWA